MAKRMFRGERDDERRDVDDLGREDAALEERRAILDAIVRLILEEVLD